MCAGPPPPLCSEGNCVKTTPAAATCLSLVPVPMTYSPCHPLGTRNVHITHIRHIRPVTATAGTQKSST